MKKLLAISVILSSVIVVVSCSDIKREPGNDYMPDMRYSRAYETYGDHSFLRGRKINYTAMPVAGTVKRGEAFPFSIPKDIEGDSTNYNMARQITNPLPALDTLQYQEAERLYLIHCGICHGTKLDGNGPLYNEGKGPYPAAPRNLVSDPHVLNMTEGQTFYSVTYGKGSMGPYGPQLSTSQRWMIVHYVKSKQGQGGSTTGAAGAAATSATTSATGTGAAGAATTATADSAAGR